MSFQDKQRPNWCSDCRDGEHDNYDDDVRFVTVRDPDQRGRFVKRAYLCSQHRQAYTDDGYDLS